MKAHGSVFLDVLLQLHPEPNRYCPNCYMRRENCECPKTGLANLEEAALKPVGRFKKPVRNVWAREEACLKLKLDDTIEESDRCWQVAYSVDKSVVDSFGGLDSPGFKLWRKRVAENTPPMWHPVARKIIGKTRRDLVIASPIGRPRADWVYLGQNAQAMASADTQTPKQDGTL